MDDSDWPDFIDIYTGVFTYFGDTKRPGRALHDTQRHGNELLRSSFEILHNKLDERVKIPPFLASGVNSIRPYVVTWNPANERIRDHAHSDVLEAGIVCPQAPGI
jgi:hypothetical protein